MASDRSAVYAENPHKIYAVGRQDTDLRTPEPLNGLRIDADIGRRCGLAALRRHAR